VKAIRLACCEAVFLIVMIGVDAGVAVRAAPQRPLTAQGQEQVKAAAREALDRAAASVRIWVGSLHPFGQTAFRRWALAVHEWKRESAPGPAPLLAEGVLLDCVERTLGLHASFHTGPAIDRRLQLLGKGNRFELAAESFNDALKLDPLLTEARFRSARIRATKDVRAAAELEEMAGSTTNTDISYLAAVSRAVIAQDDGDGPTAIRWFEHARTLRPRSAAAAIGLSVLQPDDDLDFDDMEVDDPFYNYPCRFLTPGVGEQLAARIAKLDERW
jgi:hypothetical protein